MWGFAGYKDKRAFVKRAPGAIAVRIFLDFPCETGILLFRPVADFGAAGRRRGGDVAAANGLNFSWLPPPYPPPVSQNL